MPNTACNLVPTLKNKSNACGLFFNQTLLTFQQCVHVSISPYILIATKVQKVRTDTNTLSEFIDNRVPMYKQSNNK